MSSSLTPKGSTKASPETLEQLIVKIDQALSNKDFFVADQLREKLIDKHPGALSEILKITGKIEEAKTKNIDKEHLDIWDELYQNLSDEETNNLFYSLKKVVIPPKKRILAHGSYNTKLFFIEQGTVAVFITRENKNKVIAQLTTGDLLGEYTFTTISLCSASAVSTSEVHLRYVDSSMTEKWVESTPALYDKVVKFCEKKGKIDEILRRKELKKRTHQRFDVAGNVTATLLDQKGNKTTSYIKGSLANISESGCCFDIHCSKKTVARSLLARICHLDITIDKPKEPLNISTIGKIVKVTFCLHSDYAVHIKFLEPLPKDALEPLQPEKNSL